MIYYTKSTFFATLECILLSGGNMADLEKMDKNTEIEEKKKNEEAQVCVKPFNAESSRMDDDDDPCEQFE